MRDRYFENEPDFEELMKHLRTYYKYMIECSEEASNDENVTEEEYESIIELARKADAIMYDISEKFDIPRR